MSFLLVIAKADNKETTILKYNDLSKKKIVSPS